MTKTEIKEGMAVRHQDGSYLGVVTKIKGDVFDTYAEITYEVAGLRNIQTFNVERLQSA